MEFLLLLLPHYIPHLIGLCVGVPLGFATGRYVEIQRDRDRMQAENHRRAIAIIDKQIAFEKARRTKEVM